MNPIAQALKNKIDQIGNALSGKPKIKMGPTYTKISSGLMSRYSPEKKNFTNVMTPNQKTYGVPGK